MGQRLSSFGNDRIIVVIASTIAASVLSFGLFLLLFPLYQKWRRERGMHVVLNYSLAPRPYPVNFFARTARSRNSDNSHSDTSASGGDVQIAPMSGRSSTGSVLSPIQQALLEKEERRRALNSGNRRAQHHALNMRKPSFAAEMQARQSGASSLLISLGYWLKRIVQLNARSLNLKVLRTLWIRTAQLCSTCRLILPSPHAWSVSPYSTQTLGDSLSVIYQDWSLGLESAKCMRFRRMLHHGILM
jgi:hypothetical protein